VLNRITGKITLLSPMYHGGNEKTGSVSLLNRQRWLVNGEPQEVPFVSGNAIRGYLRRLAMKDMVQLVNYEIDLNSKGGKKLFHSLFTGGVLESVEAKDSGIINLELKRKVYDYLPFARLFGFAFGNQMIESIMKVSQLLPVCTELKEYLPPECIPKLSFYDMISSTFQTRRDDIRETRESDEAVTQMLVDYETFVPGSTFHHEFRIEDATDLDMSSFARLAALWSEKPIIGGKSAVGLGELKIEYNLPEGISSKQYIEFMGKNKKKITEVLDELQGL